MRWISLKKLKELGIMGMNARNRRYITVNNPRKLYPLVDDKLKTKRIAQEHNIAVPQLYGVIKTVREIKTKLPKILENCTEFVIKPSKGSGGRGILVVMGKTENGFLKPNGELISDREIFNHVSNTLSGLYSLGGQLDCAMIEYRVKFSDVFKDISYQGIPDVRLIIYKGYPVMGMLRLATKESDGKANLHQGAIGAGIDLNSGLTLGGVSHDRAVTVHPDTGFSIDKVQIPHWQQILEICAGCYEMTSMGYIGADIVLDKELGPLILELNARPGLAIQIANGQGMRKRLDRVDAAGDPSWTKFQRVEWARKEFAVL
jgi:alpha-L-glutamate ligase-like protein